MCVENLEAWVSIWTSNNAFKHIFCGEPKAYLKNGKMQFSLGGLHYAPRYQQAQENGWAYLCSKEQLQRTFTSLVHAYAGRTQGN
ncbi:EndoU domain-containing protein [Agarivorans sp. Alg241-V36]|uniref:EndoU domain-containing protein n=1 Tax=Agarivorans sp. Alg241-V36 TaxID=2305992 RepID=UPI00196815CC